jgi:tetratricopeptide (TPR) repeat protein
MKCHESTAKSWNLKKAGALAALCLLSSVGIAYWIRAPLRAGAINTPMPTFAVAHASDGKIALDQLKQNAEEQAEPLLARLKNSPNDSILLAEIGKIYYQTGQFPLAAKYYEDSIRVKPDAVVLVKLGGAYHLNGDDDRAIRAWNHALRLEPNNPDALFNIGLVQWRVRGNRQAAIDAWQKLLKSHPNHPKRAQVEELLSQAEQ